MTTTTEKQAQGFEMTSDVFETGNGGTFGVLIRQGLRLVFCCDGLESQQHAEQIARDICVRYALVERPTI